MPPAVAAGAVAVGTIGGALIGASAQKKAANQAADTNAAATNAQLQLGQQSLAQQNALAQQSMALGKDIYNSNYGVLSPYASRGNVAGDAINALLGLPAAPAMASPLALATGQTYSAQLAAPGGTSGTPGAPSSPASATSMDQWYTGALNSLLPNITQADNIAAINAATTPQAKLAAALAISPPSSDQYAGYASYIAANPQPAAPAAPAPAPAAPQPAAPQPAQPAGASLQQQAQQAIAAGADPAAVNARLASMSAPQQAPQVGGIPPLAARQQQLGGNF